MERIPRRLALLLWLLLIGPLGIDEELRKLCRKSDTKYIVKVASLMWLGWLWQTILFTAAAHTMLSPPGGGLSLMHVGLAMLISTIIMLCDALVFIVMSWTSHGETLLARTGNFDASEARKSKLKTAGLLAGRVGAIVLVANFYGVVVSLHSFPNELDKKLVQWHVAENAALTQEKTASETRELERNRQRQGELTARIGGLSQEQRRLDGLITSGTSDDPEIARALDSVARAEAARNDAQRAKLIAEADSANEIDGRCGPRSSCKAGRGSRWAAAQARIASADRAVADAASALDKAEIRLRELKTTRAGDGRRNAGEAKERLGVVTREKEGLERQLATLTEGYQRRLSNHEASIREAVERDPRFVPKDEGLLARLRALRELMQDPAVATLVWIFDGLLVFLEVSTILARSVSLVPMEYTMRLVLRDSLLAHEIADRLKKERAQYEAPSLVPAAASGATDPLSPSPEPPKDLAPERPRNARHAPPLKPPFRSTGSEEALADGALPVAPNMNGRPPSPT